MRVPALVVMHGDLAEALLGAARQMYGPMDGIEAMSNAGLDKSTLTARIADRLASWLEGGIVFVDQWGSSCHQCAAAASRDRGCIAILTGANVSMLLDYMHNREALAVPALSERLVRKGQEGIRLQPGRVA